MNRKNLPFRFMAMSKLIGIIAFLFVFMVVIYVMYEMHRSMNYDAMPQLILSAFGFASVYAGFYLLMAKVEHIEEERTKREKEILLLQKNKNSPQEEIERKRAELDSINQKIMDVLNESMQSLL